MQLSFSKVSLRNRTCVGDETTWPRLQKHDHRKILWSFCYELTCSKSLVPNIFLMMVLWWLIALGSMLVLQWGHDNSSPSLNSQSWLTVLEGRSLKSIEKNLNGFQKLIIFEVGACGLLKKVEPSQPHRQKTILRLIFIFFHRPTSKSRPLVW